MGQRAPELQTVKVGVYQKILLIGPARAKRVRTWLIGIIFFWPPILTACRSTALWPTETHSTSLERSKPPLLTQTLSKSLAVLLMYFISVQSTLISIEFISKGAVFVGPICILFLAWKWWGKQLFIGHQMPSSLMFKEKDTFLKNYYLSIFVRHRYLNECMIQTERTQSFPHLYEMRWQVS